MSAPISKLKSVIVVRRDETSDLTHNFRKALVDLFKFFRDAQPPAACSGAPNGRYWLEPETLLEFPAVDLDVRLSEVERALKMLRKHLK